MDISTAPDGALWLCTFDTLSVVRANGTRLEFDPGATPADLAGHHEVVSVAPDGSVWIGATTGLWRLWADDFVHFTVADGLGDLRIMNVIAISADEVWVSYEQPIGPSQLKLNEEGISVRHFSSAHGLASDME